MRLAVVGTGYVGLVTGACLAEMGHRVICMDNDMGKIDALKHGVIPIWEPGLEDIVKRNIANGTLLFTTDIECTVNDSDIIFIAVGTPPGEDGSADLHYVLDVAGSIAKHMQQPKIVVDKSTVPVGTGELVSNAISQILKQRNVDLPFAVVSNPEFLKEGAAVEDFMKPDRIIVGTDDPQVAATMKELYSPFNMNSERVIVMSLKSAEMTKYAANAMLATKISFINEIAMLCERYGADISEVRHGIGSDSRIGYQFIYPGVGYGGSCFPKDVKALIMMAKKADFVPSLLQAVEARNETQKHVLADKVLTHFGSDLSQLTFGIWGLSFKPQTDDMREAPSVVIINRLLAAGAKLRLFDPVAQEQARLQIAPSDRVQYCEHQYDAITGVDALLLITEWHQFRKPDLAKMKEIMKQPVVFDGRNQYDPSTMAKEGFAYYGIGR